MQAHAAHSTGLAMDNTWEKAGTWNMKWQGAWRREIISTGGQGKRWWRFL